MSIDWNESGLNKDSDILTFLLAKNSLMLGIDVVQAVRSGNYTQPVRKAIQHGGLFAYEIGMVRLNRAVLDFNLETSRMQAGPYRNPTFTCDSGYNAKGERVSKSNRSSTNQIVDYDSNYGSRQFTMFWWSFLCNGVFGVVQTAAGLSVTGIPQHPPPNLAIPLPNGAINVVNPLHVANNLLPNLPVDVVIADPIVNNLRSAKGYLSAGSSLALYIWLFAKNMKETGEYKCPDF